MASKYWIKLYHEILDDPKMGRMSDVLFARCIKIFLLAGEHNQAGKLPPVDDMAWRLRTNPEQLESDLIELQKIGIVRLTDTGWIVCKFAERQEAMKPAEKMRRQRNTRQLQEYYEPRYQRVTKSNADTEEDTDTEEDEELTPPASFPQTPLEAQKHPDIKLFYEVSKVTPGKNDYAVVIDAIQLLRKEHPDESELESYLVPFWLAWQTRKGKDGQPYKRTNPAWLTDWAVNNDIPKNGSEPVPTTNKVNYGELRAAQEANR